MVSDSSNNKTDVWSTRAYVLGEIVISLAIIVGGFYILVTAPNNTTADAASIAALSGVTVFWFSRRASEQATNNMKEATNGALKALSDRVDLINSTGTSSSNAHLQELHNELATLALQNAARIATLEQKADNK